jgi:uroporphyrinogen III methyltransferase / synthase
MPSRAGYVWLVGAGPGDPGLLTLRGREALEAADLVVIDRLANPALLRRARTDVEVVHAGKAPGGAGMTQEEITALLVREGQAGRRVCRLKGGDPFVFGRGGEEAEALAAAGVAFEIVPGVTSAFGGPAYAGIPVTQRGIARSVAVATAHGDDATDQWDRLVDADTLVLLMGMARLERTVTGLLASGRAPETPVAIVQWATTPRQRVVTGTLADIVAGAAEAGIGSPAVVVVGEVVRLRERLRWFDDRPLFGRRIIVTRSRAQASEMAEQLARLGAEVIEFPTIRLEPLPQTDLSALKPAPEWIVFPSPAAVEALLTALLAHGQDARAFAGSRIAAVGAATVEVLRKVGIRADFSPSPFTGAELARSLPEPVAGARVVLARGEDAPEEWPAILRERGAYVDTIALYRNVPDIGDVPALLGELEAGVVDMLTFASSSSARNFAGVVPSEACHGVPVACIGPSTALAARELGFEVRVEAEVHTIPGLVATITAFFAANEETA